MAQKELERHEQMDEFFTRGAWLLDWPGKARLRGLSIKADIGGYLAIVKVASTEGPLVGFLGKGTVWGLYCALHSEAGREAMRWRPDQYFLDNLEKK
jgi:hypothetical protein